MQNEKLIKEALSYSLASDLHEIWRKNRKLKDGSFDPKYKKSKDEDWNISNGKDEADIANLSFKELPFNCQDEELEEPRIIIDLVFNKVMAGEEFSHQEIEKISSIIHKEWQKQNDWIFDPDYGESDLAVPFENLSKEKQDEYSLGIIPGIKKVESYKNGNLNIEEICEQYGLTHTTKNR